MIDNKSNNNKKILVISSREICYFSGSFFAKQLAKAFEELGFIVEYLELSKDDELDSVLPKYYHGDYELILDVNTKLGNLSDDEGAVIDLFGGPFFNYVVDHPLFHYNNLNGDGKNMHAILIDESQKAYVDKYYPSVKSSMMMPLAAVEAIGDVKKKSTPDSVLMIGTYGDYNENYKAIDSAEEPLRSLMKQLLEIRLSNPILPMHEAFEGLISDLQLELTNQQFALYLNHMYQVDTYIRNFYRQRCMEALLDANIPITVVGEYWDKFKTSKDKLLFKEKGIDISLSYNRIAKEHILINSAPMFPYGVHDRVLAALANHCVALTDDNPYIRDNFKLDKELMVYDPLDLKTLTNKAEALLTNPSLCYDMKACGFELYKEKHTWENRAKMLLEYAGVSV